MSAIVCASSTSVLRSASPFFASQPVNSRTLVDLRAPPRACRTSRRGGPRSAISRSELVDQPAGRLARRARAQPVDQRRTNATSVACARPCATAANAGSAHRVREARVRAAATSASFASVVCADAALRHRRPRAGTPGRRRGSRSARRYATEVLDLGALEPRLAARHVVRNRLRAERGLERPRLVVAAVEHRVVGPAPAMLEAVRRDRRGDELGLGFLVAAPRRRGSRRRGRGRSTAACRRASRCSRSARSRCCRMRVVDR